MLDLDINSDQDLEKAMREIEKRSGKTRLQLGAMLAIKNLCDIYTVDMREDFHAVLFELMMYCGDIDQASSLDETLNSFDECMSLEDFANLVLSLPMLVQELLDPATSKILINIMSSRLTYFNDQTQSLLKEISEDLPSPDKVYN